MNIKILVGRYLVVALLGGLLFACGIAVPVAAQSTAGTTQAVANQVVNLPPGETMDPWEHIFWDTSKGPDANQADCKAVGGTMQWAPGSRRCFILIKAWLALAPGNVIGEECIPGKGRSIPVLLSPKDVQNLKADNLLVWTSADRKPFGYEQASKCNGK